MPIPAIAGIPWLASAIGGIIGSLVAFLAKFLTRKLAIKAGYVTGFLLLLTIFAAFIVQLMTVVVIVLPEGYGVMLSYLIPWNLPLCISVIVTARLGKWLWQFKVNILQSVFRPLGSG